MKKSSILMLIVGLVVGLGLTFGVYYFFFRNETKVMECPKYQECEKCTETKCEEKECPKCEECKSQQVKEIYLDINSDGKLVPSTSSNVFVANDYYVIALNERQCTHQYAFFDNNGKNIKINDKGLSQENGFNVIYGQINVKNNKMYINFEESCLDSKWDGPYEVKYENNQIKFVK